MALFGNLFGGRKESKKKNDWKKETSFMVVIPKNAADIENLEVLAKRLEKTDFSAFEGMEHPVLQLVKDYESELVTLKDSKPSGNGLMLKVASGELEYVVRLDTMEVEIPEMFRIQHFFRDIDIEEIQRQERGLIVEMLFDEHILESYHTQLKVINQLLPDCLAVLDGSSEKVLSGKWIALAAKSNVPPSPRYLFTAQTVSVDSYDVWLYSH